MHRSFGLTGGIASGKSTVARFLEALGAKVVDADRVGHELLRPSNPVHHKVVAHFGQDILKPSGDIDRERLGSIVFGDPEKLGELNSIVHPALTARVRELTRELHERYPQEVIIVDAALIYEAGVEGRFAKIIVAWCTPEQQIERLMAKAGLSRDDALHRLAAQIPLRKSAAAPITRSIVREASRKRSARRSHFTRNSSARRGPKMENRKWKFRGWRRHCLLCRRRRAQIYRAMSEAPRPTLALSTPRRAAAVHPMRPAFP